ncbi:hypothetical protein Q5P01_023942 [Channa striata]|uniref:Dynein heavy chain hydrolytic ATP-binding dynein motor region domain-containing protein n=1 Tax=Channa striata TaxID=64152 RepID=A0AA88LLK7_CHASR|nr:hypothetical protein Q5P01_023942 [Channa striata]
MHSVLSVELPLVQGQLRDIDDQLRKAEETLAWNSQVVVDDEKEAGPATLDKLVNGDYGWWGIMLRFDNEHPYQMLDAFHQQVLEREAVIASLVESASLFEVIIPEYKQLWQCSALSIMSKNLDQNLFDREPLGMQVQNEHHHRTPVPLQRIDVELFKTLEDNQVQLQNLMSSKYFQDEVSAQRSKLSVANSVIFIWFRDSRRFEGICADFKELADAMHYMANVVEATNKPGVFHKLQDIQSRIVTDDMPVFMELTGQLFPALDIPIRRDLDFEKHVKESILNLELQAVDYFVLKVVQLEKLLVVRHSVFVMENTGTGKGEVLTLDSNERIPLNPNMTLAFEISHLHTTTPATVSRAGIFYINEADLGRNPSVCSWIDRREVQLEKANLILLSDLYLPLCLDAVRYRFKKIVAIPEQSMVQNFCYLLECLLSPEKKKTL